jgi:phosphoenolpyruvate---glycerone phosphotransferase subunit DhaL
MVASLTVDAVKARLIAASQAVVDNQDRLTKADQAIGDGDHGVGMARGFKAAREALETKPAASVGDLFRNAGMAVMMKSGGASGAVFGTFLSGMGKAIGGTELDATAFVAALSQGLADVQTRGRAKSGDKTMIDALVPAIEAAASATDIEEALRNAANAALSGVEATKAMIATTGKAKALGERSRGHPDPGAITLSILLGALVHS